MKTFRIYVMLLLAAPMALPSCDSQIRGQLDIRTNGFISDSCFQALIVFEPDESARGLVARRENSSQKAKKADIREMALDVLVAYAVDGQMKSGIIDANRKDFDLPGHRARLAEQLRSVARGGKTVFSYYNESNAMVVGYAMTGAGLKNRIEDLIKKPAATTQQNATTEQRSQP